MFWIIIISGSLFFLYTILCFFCNVSNIHLIYPVKNESDLKGKTINILIGITIFVIMFIFAIWFDFIIPDHSSKPSISEIGYNY
jgi:hypothetical protein